MRATILGIATSRARMFAGCWMLCETIAFVPTSRGCSNRLSMRCSMGANYYFHLADFDGYLAAQHRVSADFQDAPAWALKAILNVARSGKFTSDRAVAEYAKDIWAIKSIVP